MDLNISNNQHTYPFIIGNVKIPFFYQPNFNPNKITFTSKKAYNRTQTIGGNVFEAWGKDPVVMHVEMTVKKQDYAAGIIGVYQDLGVEDPFLCYEMAILQRLYEFDQRKLKDLSAKENWSQAKQSFSNIGKGESYLDIFKSTAGGTINGLTNIVGTAGASVADAAAKGVQTLIGGVINNYADTIIYYKTNIYTGFFTDFYYEEDGRNPFINKVTFNFTVTSSIQDTLNNWLATTTTGRGILGVLGAASAVTTATTFLDKAISGITSTVTNLGRL